MGGRRSCYNNRDAAKPSLAEKLPAKPPCLLQRAMPRLPRAPQPRGQWGWRGAARAQGHPADLCPAPKCSSRLEHPNMGGASSPASRAPALRHARALKRPDWGDFSHCCLGSPSRPRGYRRAVYNGCHPKGKHIFLQSRTCPICPSPSSNHGTVGQTPKPWRRAVRTRL